MGNQRPNTWDPRFLHGQQVATHPDAWDPHFLHDQQMATHPDAWDSNFLHNQQMATQLMASHPTAWDPGSLHHAQDTTQYFPTTRAQIASVMSDVSFQQPSSLIARTTAQESGLEPNDEGCHEGLKGMNYLRV
jgi:hypothetical protein